MIQTLFWANLILFLCWFQSWYRKTKWHKRFDGWICGVGAALCWLGMMVQ